MANREGFYPRQGEVFRAEIPDAEPHLVVVIAKDSLNRGVSILVAGLTSQYVDRRRKFETSVYFSPGSYPFITRECVLQAEMTERIPVYRLKETFGTLAEFDVRRVQSALAEVFGIDHIPDLHES